MRCELGLCRQRFDKRRTRYFAAFMTADLNSPARPSQAPTNAQSERAQPLLAFPVTNASGIPYYRSSQISVTVSQAPRTILLQHARKPDSGDRREQFAP
jgi:hypothetical protein